MTNEELAGQTEQELSLAVAAEWVAAAKKIVVLTGAGISAESGIPTFRDAQTGFWAQYKPEDMASEKGYRTNPAMVWRWYEYRRELVAKVDPNAGHLALAEFEKRHPGAITLVLDQGGRPQLRELAADRALGDFEDLGDLADLELAAPSQQVQDT